MTRMTRWIGAGLIGGLVLGGMTPASAAEWRWPWERPSKERKEKKEKTVTTPEVRTTPAPGATPGAEVQGTEQDRSMLTRLQSFYGEQLDLAVEAEKSKDPQVKSFASKLRTQSERALALIGERARSIGFAMKPHVPDRVKSRLFKRQAGGREEAARQSDAELLQEVMSNIQEIRPEFAAYKESVSDKSFHSNLETLFDEQLVPNYDEAKRLHDRVRNENRSD